MLYDLVHQLPSRVSLWQLKNLERNVSIVLAVVKRKQEVPGTMF